MKIIVSVILFVLICLACSEEKKFTRKAAIAVDQCDYEKSIMYYDKILEKDSSSFFGNTGKGVVLSEYMEKHEDAIPYLEKALRKTKKNTAFKINSDLGKSYHRTGNYRRALYFYSKAADLNNSDNPDYDFYLSKRIADCKYALAHTEVAPEILQQVKNIGKPINTNMPEYNPVFTGNRLLFTSQRKDSPKEKKNGIDGKYFEGIYISYLEGLEFSNPKRFTLPDTKKYLSSPKKGESILSVSADGEKLFVLRRGKIYESSVTENKIDELNKTINFSKFQSHACLSADGKTLLFTSEDDDGFGGTDIYFSEKDKNGNWSEPYSISAINTVYNEDSPYLSEDGTLYFSSNGLPGYGGYDVYKTILKNGQCSVPENLGQPVNSPADDIYFTLKPKSSDGYFASGRIGGAGDMDIYQVHYVPESKTAKDSVLTVADAEKPLPLYSGTTVVNGSNTDKIDEDGNFIRTDLWADAGTAKTLKSPAKKAAAREHKELSKGARSIRNNGSNTINNNLKVLSDAELKALGWNTSFAYFEFNSAALSSSGKNLLDNNINILKAHDNLSLSVHGYTDSRGSDEYNKRLAAKRAAAVRNYIAKKGVSLKRVIATFSIGEKGLVNNCNNGSACTEQQHSLNRRVELKVYDTGEKALTFKK